MTPQELIAHCRTKRQGKPEGDIRSPAVVADVLTMLLEDHMADLARRSRPPSGGRLDSLSGRVVFSEPAVPAPDPRADPLACSIATLVGYLQDAASK
jgi:hypothetical protein